jgi:GntR family transcriptional regulator, transcriptional repressor for pyruvate dehydrogenase complex
MTDRDAPPARSQTDVVIDSIKTMLTTGQLRAGSRLPVEKDLATQLGVSRGSLREGVRALATLGVLETRQGDGTYVTALDPARLLSPIGFFAELQESSNAAELLAVRRVLEEESAFRAATRLSADDLGRLEAILAPIDAMTDDESTDPQASIAADTAFHTAIAAASGNPALAALIDALVSRTFRARLWRAVAEHDAVREAHLEHRAILRELVAGDADRARIRMSAHLLGVEEYLQEHPDVAAEAAETA